MGPTLARMSTIQMDSQVWLLASAVCFISYKIAYTSVLWTLSCMETISVDWELGLQADTENYTYWNKPPWFLWNPPKWMLPGNPFPWATPSPGAVEPGALLRNLGRYCGWEDCAHCSHIVPCAGVGSTFPSSERRGQVFSPLSLPTMGTVLAAHRSRGRPC